MLRSKAPHGGRLPLVVLAVLLATGAVLFVRVHLAAPERAAGPIAAAPGSAGPGGGGR